MSSRRKQLEGVMTPSNPYEIMPDEFKLEKRTYPNYERIGVEIPYRMLVIGAPASGKTMSVIDMLLKQACFSQWVLLCKQLDEALWQWIISVLKKSGESAGIDESDYLVTGTQLSA